MQICLKKHRGQIICNDLGVRLIAVNTCIPYSFTAKMTYHLYPFPITFVALTLHPAMRNRNIMYSEIQ